MFIITTDIIIWIKFDFYLYIPFVYTAIINASCNFEIVFSFSMVEASRVVSFWIGGQNDNGRVVRSESVPIPIHLNFVVTLSLFLSLKVLIKH